MIQLMKQKKILRYGSETLQFRRVPWVSYHLSITNVNIVTMTIFKVSDIYTMLFYVILFT